MRRMAALLLLVIAAWLCVSLPARAIRPEAVPPQGQTDLDKYLAVIVNRSNPLEDISFAELRKVFLGEKNHWPNGHRITVVMQDSGQSERKTVLRDVYQMSEQDFSRYFLHGTFTGEVFAAPKTLANSTGVRKFVFNVPSAIGYVRATEVDDSVKAIRVDGLLPGDQGYKIRLEAR